VTQAAAAMRECTEHSWQVNGLRLAGLSWGEPGEFPVLALHGWLDNAASFARLGPLLDGCHLVALDLTGHGRSDRRSADAGYQIWDDLPEILGVVAQLGWDRFALLGHSRGAIIGTLLAAAFADRVSHLIMLDAISPEPVAPGAFVRQMRQAVLDKARLLDRENRVFGTVAEAVGSRASHGLSHSAVEGIVRRNIRRCEGGYTWTTDPRLHGASAVKLTEAQIQAVLDALAMPVLLLLARDAAGEQRAWLEEHARSHITGVIVESITGGHHFHMEDSAPEVSAKIATFFSSGTGETAA